MRGLLFLAVFIVGMVVIGVFVIALLEWIEENKKEWNMNVAFHAVLYGVAVIVCILMFIFID